MLLCFFFFQAEDGIRDLTVTGVQTCALPISRNLTKSSGAHDKAPNWSPDGAKIAFISDRTGEEEIYVVPQDGSAAAEQISQGGKAMRYNPDWSPDGKQIAFSDKDGRLFVITLTDKRLTEVAHSKLGVFRKIRWPPRGN